MKKFMPVRSNWGFTLIELLVVVAIIGILATIAYVNFAAFLVNAKDARRIADLKTLSQDLEEYYQKHNSYPCPAGGIPVGKEDDVKNCRNTESPSINFDLLYDSLSEIRKNLPTDPQTGDRYCYVPVVTTPANTCQDYRLFAKLENCGASNIPGICTPNTWNYSLTSARLLPGPLGADSKVVTSPVPSPSPQPSALPSASPSPFANPINFPGKPTFAANQGATPGDQQATITWTAPDNGGSPIRSYTVTSTPGGKTGLLECGPQGNQCPALSATVLDLTNNVPYTFKVVASNIKGPGPASDPSNEVTPKPPVPEKPVLSSASAGDRQATLTWHTPADFHNSTISSYDVGAYTRSVSAPFTYTLASSSRVNCAGTNFCTTPDTAVTTAVLQLTNNTDYYFKVKVNYGASSTLESDPSSFSVKPVGTPPDPPANVAAAAGNCAAGNDCRADVSWTPVDSAHSGDNQPVKSYTITSIPEGSGTAVTTTVSCPCTVQPDGKIHHTVLQLSASTTYTFKVKAFNQGDVSSTDSNAPTAITRDTNPPGGGIDFTN